MTHAEDTARLLDRTEAAIRKYIVIDDHEAAALALWVLHTHATYAAHMTPYMAITSPEPGCGKSVLIEVLEGIVANGWRFDDPPTRSVLARVLKVGTEGETLPTILVDEFDLLDPESDLRSVLKAGYKRGARAIINEPKAGGWEPVKFEVFGAKALGGIRFDKWPAQIRDRSIPVFLHKYTGGNKPADFYADPEQIDELHEFVPRSRTGLRLTPRSSRREPVGPRMC
jgi:hypothetical protein